LSKKLRFFKPELFLFEHYPGIHSRSRDIHSMVKKQLYKQNTASYVIEHEVSKQKEEEFQRWQQRITEVASEFDGYLGTNVCSPVEPDCKWYIVVQFDSPDTLTHWLESDTRHELVEIGKQIFLTSKITHFKTGLERWFVKQEASPPSWKQILATLVGLYPTVMLLNLVQSSLPWLKSWAFADVMLLSNFLSCCLLTWLVMPFVAWLFKAWLEPKTRHLTQINWIGAALVLIALALMRSIFAKSF
jgi:antibiotic biosynthesis monooxygenase (ABM) superfamily enzyme